MIKFPLEKIILQENMRKHIKTEHFNLYENGSIGQLQKYKFDRLKEDRNEEIPPIILDNYYRIINGRHRVTMAINNDFKYINALINE